MSTTVQSINQFAEIFAISHQNDHYYNVTIAACDQFNWIHKQALQELKSNPVTHAVVSQSWTDETSI